MQLLCRECGATAEDDEEDLAADLPDDNLDGGAHHQGLPAAGRPLSIYLSICSTFRQLLLGKTGGEVSTSCSPESSVQTVKSILLSSSCVLFFMCV